MRSRTWRFLAVAACAVLFLPLSACGDDGSDTGSDTGYDTTTPTTDPMGPSGTGADPMDPGSAGTMDDGSVTGTAPMNTGTDTTGMGAMDPGTR